MLACIDVSAELSVVFGMRSSPPQERGGFHIVIDGLVPAIVHPMPPYPAGLG
jgi:hypothetical protein